ncbi:BCD family MFS transporter [Synechococcus sp. CBW1002]|uniref:BCD family MFS transporter n=1 Tax=unclassified Synechococcus TaxID=2626047 RepID=UPI0018CEF5A5|nr:MULTISPECIES: BCD family MFS transporter [unclassified Synechococcus]QPN60303.1 BCD family MFS transporter [Synechococcus sp. CBW1002]QPN67981.1 BCD family MFS transporter [Synechococcus sp. CBW1006]CAK6689928.1 Protein PucC [Synechococcus sp. CBW1107]
MASAAPPLSPLRWIDVLRLSLFQGCVGAMAAVFVGMLNRVMITELALPALLVGGALACEQFVAPSRVLFGHLSDNHPIAGRHRLPYILLGAVLFSLLALLSVPLVFHTARLLDGGIGLTAGFSIAAIAGLFALYGLAVSMATTPYLALVIDRTTESQRPRAVSLLWCMLTVGIIVASIAIRLSLRSLDGVTDPSVLEPVLAGFMQRLVLVVLALTLLAIAGMEPARLPQSVASSRDDAITLAQSWALITSSRQVAVFFGFLVLFTLALFIQDPILESFGGEVFSMPISATALLTTFWGVGTLLGLVMAGLWVVPRLGKLPTARLGCQLILLSLLLLMVSGVLGQVAFLKVVMLIFGLASGIATNSALCLMLDLTLPQAAGTFVGVWGLAQALSRALGKLVGGGLLDLGRLLFPGAPALAPYLLVFGIEALVAFAAILLLSRVNLRQFREDTGRSLSRVLALELG